MRKSRKPSHRTSGPKPQKSNDGPPVLGNRQLTQQTRKLLGKHYASKYRVR